MGVADLTPRQRQVWDCRHAENPPKTLDRVAEELGIQPGNARFMYQGARESLGLAGGGYSGAGNLVESREGALAAQAM